MALMRKPGWPLSFVKTPEKLHATAVPSSQRYPVFSCAPAAARPRISPMRTPPFEQKSGREPSPRPPFIDLGLCEPVPGRTP